MFYVLQNESEIFLCA